MRLRPELQALRSDDAPQRQLQGRLIAALDDWRARASVARVLDDLAKFGSGAALGTLPALAALFRRDDPAAGKLCGTLVSLLTAKLAAAPLGLVSLRHHCDETISTLAIATCGAATLALQAVDGTGIARRKAAVSVGFAPGETYEHVLAGSAEADRLRRMAERPGGTELGASPCQLGPGTVMQRDSANEALVLRSVSGILVSLKLQRRAGAGSVTREYRLSDGALVHQAAACARESRLELTAALLGRMGRRDAAPLLAAMAEEEAGQSLRWQSLKECLGLDTAEGFAALCRIAASAADPLAAPAGALRAQLLETYPELAGAGSCPA